ncbi:MAG: penicillin-insensitive murein endopeptidase [Rhodobacteraceae bacterium]|nr:penicillin-insensitive murein endopeptidase [Paracoccaceae bacterium]
MVRPLVLISLVLALATPAAAEPLANRLFGAKAAPSAQPPAAVGSYARGCAAGLVEMPQSGPTWQVMRLSRNRNWGQPVMIDYLRDLGAAAARIGWGGIYIGDISQPRGGPMTSGHASHQVGLDADIWMLPPKSLALSRAERERISSVSVRSTDQTRVTGAWTPAHAALLHAAAADPRVDRIFVTPVAKIALCSTATKADTPWLQKIRPFYGHDTHFHVRLKCPPGSQTCQSQTPTVDELSKGGNGCDASLNWWVTGYLDDLRNPPKKPANPGPRPRRARDFTMKDLPRQCASVLSSR